MKIGDWALVAGGSALVIAAVVVGLTFSLRQWHNFIWGFQVQFVGVYALACLSILLFVRALVSRSRGGRLG